MQVAKEETGVPTGFSVLAKTLNRSTIPNLQNHIQIFNIKIYDHEKINIDHAESVLKRCREFDVAYVVSRSMLKREKAPLVQLMLSLQKECTVICPCLSTKRPPAPVDFPCQMAIAVGIEAQKEDSSTDQETEETSKEEIALKPAPVKTDWMKWQSCGSALDFLCHRQYKDVRIKDPWQASYYTTAIAALILVNAYALGE